jgi:hypothetical protein
MPARGRLVVTERIRKFVTCGNVKKSRIGQAEPELVLENAGMLSRAPRQGETHTMTTHSDDPAVQPDPQFTPGYAELDMLLLGAPPAAQFKDIGATVIGKVTRAVVRQATDFDTKQPKYWPDGAPILEPVIGLENADGPLTLYAGSSGMREALREACRDAGVGLRPGGTLLVRYIADEPSKKGGSARKVYEAAYDPPESVRRAAAGGPTMADQIAADRQSRVAVALATSGDPPF